MGLSGIWPPALPLASGGRRGRGKHSPRATMQMAEVVQTSSYEQLEQLQADAIRRHARKLGCHLSILEAGCGQCWVIDLSGVEYTLTGVDLDPVALEIRKTQSRDLDVAIVGDVCSADFPEAEFDVVYSAFVLEHVQRADLALQNFCKWLRPGGLLILRLPERATARGFLTRILPHFAHVWYYRFVLGSKSAGCPGHAPYPTYYHPVIGRKRLHRFLGARRVAIQASYADGFRREGSGMTELITRAILKITSMVTLGYLTAAYSDLLYIAAKEVEASQLGNVQNSCDN
jgi:SAM-dependent methyltransferase